LKGPVELTRPCWAVILIKARRRCKARLSASLSPSQRAMLADAMLRRVIDCCRAVSCIDQVLVVSPEQRELGHDVQQLQDAGTGMAAAAEQGRRYALLNGARQVVVLSADLPELTSAALEQFVRTDQQLDCIIAADQAGSGTNALCLRGDAGFRYAYGPGSCERHAAHAAEDGLRGRVLLLPELAIDLDWPEQLAGAGSLPYLREVGAWS
jgi:2-phospho-L-lactate guanylyltransferase